MEEQKKENNMELEERSAEFSSETEKEYIPEDETIQTDNLEWNGEADENSGHASEEMKDDTAAPKDSEKTKSLKNTVRKSFSSKNSRFGMYSSGLTAIVLVVFVVVNLLCSYLPKSISNIDLSESNLTEIGAQTEKLLKKLDKEVTIQVLGTEDASDEDLARLLKRYEKASDKITVTYVDTAKNPGIADTYADYSNNSLIVSCNGGTAVIDYNDIYQTDYSNYYTTGQASSSFDGEGQITGAIYRLSSNDAQTLYTLQGHGETALGTGTSSMFAKQNMVTADLNLLSQDIPSDCAGIIINGPTKDLSSEEADKLLAYLQKGGKVMVLLDYSDSDMVNLERVLNAFCVKTVDGIVMETSQNYYNYPINILAGVESSDITGDIASGSTNILITTAIGLKTLESDTVTVTTLLTSSDGAYAKRPTDGQFATLERESGDIEGPFPLAVLAKDSASGGMLTVISTSSLIDDNITQQFPVENLTLFMNCITEMCCEDGADSSISIAPKSLDISYITVPNMQKILWGLVVIILIPIGLLITGLVLWLVRRKR